MEAGPARRRPLVVVDVADLYADVLAEVAGAGWHLVSPRQVAGPADCAEWLVSSEADVHGALISAASGAGVVVRVTVPAIHAVGSPWEHVIEDLAEDLASLGPVVRPTVHDVVTLDRLTWQVVHDLARGLTLEGAATRAHLSSRTANRRVSDAREAFGAQSRAHLLRALRLPGRVPAAVIAR